MIKQCLLGLFLFSSTTQARSTSLDYFLRAENWSSKDENIPKTLIGANFHVETQRFKFYLDSFAEADFAGAESRDWRRAENQVFLQELYMEISNKSFFVKFGKQALRWSESWTIPSLDIWTARKYNRLFTDPLPMQLSHSTGVLMSYVRPAWSLDFAMITEVAQDRYPKPFPEKIDVLEPEKINPGLRWKFDIDSFQTSVILARSLRKNYLGTAFSYAFESWVPKLELGTFRNEQKDFLLEDKNFYFTSLGSDIFFSELTITPQFTSYDSLNDVGQRTKELISYLSTTYTHKKHEFQMVGYTLSKKLDHFLSFTYTYLLSKSWSISGLVQNYGGDPGTTTNSLPKIVDDETGGQFFGLRVQFNDGLYNQ